MSNDLCVVTAYCDTDKKVELLKKCIIDLKSKNRDIFLTTHFPVSFEIQKMVEYYYYDHNNDILTSKNGGFEKYNINLWQWEYINNHKINYNYSYLDEDVIVHAYAIWTSMQNAIALIKIKKYKKLHFLGYDVLIGPSDMLDEHNKILEEKDSVIYHSGHVAGIISMSIETADKIFSLYKDIDDYFINETLDFLIENRIYQLLLKHNINFHQFSFENLMEKIVCLNGNSISKNHDSHDLFNDIEHFYFIIIPDSNLNNHIIIDNKKPFEYECFLLIDDCVKQIKINESRQSMQLDTNKNEYDVKIFVNNTILFNDVVKVKEHIHYEKQ